MTKSLLPDEFVLTDWDSVKNYFSIVKSSLPNINEPLEDWLIQVSDLQAHLSEDFAWRYIKMTKDSYNVDDQKSYQYYVNELHPKFAKEWFAINKLLIKHPQFDNLSSSGFDTYTRSVKAEVELYREENLKLVSEIANLNQDYSTLMASLEVFIGSERMTMEAAQAVLNEKDREKRIEAFYQVNDVRISHAVEIHRILNELLVRRVKMAYNAGFENFLEYQFKNLGRFDFSIDDCKGFHESVKRTIIPILNEIYLDRKKRLKIDQLRPWDLKCDPDGKDKLMPAKTVPEMLDLTVKCLSEVDPMFGKTLSDMKEKGLLDLESRRGKSPGGYNYPLLQSGMPFIFMNAVGSHSDLVVLVHEAGHAVHSMLCNHHKISAFKTVPSEVAELASMTMELLSMDKWNILYNEADLVRAKKAQIERIIMLLPHIATIDKFQHWLYEHPEHLMEERKEVWKSMFDEFQCEAVNFFGLDHYFVDSWQSVIHIMEMPLYFIEYGFAQLGAVAIWRNYKKDPDKTLKQFKSALSLGSSKPVPEVYKAAGIEFNFSEKYIKELGTFLMEEYKAL